MNANNSGNYGGKQQNKSCFIKAFTSNNYNKKQTNGYTYVKTFNNNQTLNNSSSVFVTKRPSDIKKFTF
jgi:hypothetical protein